MPPRALHPVRLLLVVAALAAPARATLVRPLALADVARAAGRIVHGTVVDVRSGRDDSGLPATWLTLDVVRTVKGPRTRRLVVKQYGGVAALPDGTLTRVPGVPRYAVGEEVVLFLRPPSRLGFTSPVGLGQGAYRVRRRGTRARVRRDLGGDGARDLDAFLADVERLAR